MKKFKGIFLSVRSNYPVGIARFNYTTICKKFVLFIAMILVMMFYSSFISLAQAANWYVRPSGGSGSGTNWTTAWNGLNGINWGSVSCGDTIWVAGGSYSSEMSPNKSCSAGAPLSIRRARSDATECTGATGWISGYDSLITQTNASIGFSGTANYITISGRTTASGGGYGWLIRRTGTSGNGIDFYNGANTNYITIEYMELYGPGGATATADARGIDDTPGSSSSSHHTFSHLKIHDFESGIYAAFYDYHTSEYIDMYNIYGNSTQHPNLYYIIGSSNGIIRHSKFHDSSASGTGIAFSDGGVFNNWAIHGNIFYDMSTSSGTAISIQQSAANGLKIYNNTFSNNVINFYLAGGGTCGTGSESKNNLFYGSGRTVNCGTQSNNLEISSPNSLSNFAGKDFHIVSNIGTGYPRNAGTALGSAYSTDMDGTIRGGDGVWDIGAYEYKDGYKSESNAVPYWPAIQGIK